MIENCLNCSLPICDESLPGCAFVQIRRDAYPAFAVRPATKPRTDDEGPGRRRYFREYKRRRKVNPAVSYTDAQLKRDLLKIILKI